MKNIFLFLILITPLITPLRANAWFEDTENCTAETPADETKNNSQAGRVEATQNEAGEGKSNPRDGSETVALPDDNSAAATSLAAAEQADHSSSDPQTNEKSASSADLKKITLEDFQQALRNNPNASRFILKEKENGRFIEPGQIEDGNVEILRSEDVDVLDALRDALEERYGAEAQRIVSEVIGQNNLLTYQNSHLSAVRLDEILKRASDLTTIRTASFCQDLPLLDKFDAHSKKERGDAQAAFENLRKLPRDPDGKVQDEAARKDFLNLLATYEKKAEIWAAGPLNQGLTGLSLLEGVLKEHARQLSETLVASLDIGTARDGAVFWTGYDKENQRTAMAYAAAEAGKKTIEMIADGRFLDKLGMYDAESPIAWAETDAQGKTRYKSKLGDLLFDAASKKFAEGASGHVTAVIYKPSNFLFWGQSDG